MNRNKLKTYAPAARRDFLQAVKDRATHYGLSAKKIEPMTERGDVVLIAGQPFPKSVAAKRTMLEQRIERDGYDRTIEAAAYTWFNRFVAIRFMELHGYLDHGYRVLSHPAGGVQPEILDHAQRVDFPGLEKAKVLELKLDGTKQEELYRLLLVAQCNALNKAMPFLFEKIEDETELLLPANLLATDSLIRKLVEEVDEADWQEVEILGWLYQFYISERKDEVIGKVVASEDIPAATQLFTPNWIVKYLVQNTLGRTWLATYPQSAIRQQMEFYIEPAEQTPEVQEQLKAITPTSLNPEELTLLDPACGSAHILVEAYDLFKAIYQERGYRAKDIPGLILQKNLFGLEIDDRAAQLAAFALFMKARADDRRVFESGVQPNVLAFVESKGMDAGAITHSLNSPITGEEGAVQSHVAQADVEALLSLFTEAKTFGSLIRLPPALASKLPAIEDRLAAVLKDGDLTHAQSAVIAPLLRQAYLLCCKHDAVVANPPYLGFKGMHDELKKYGAIYYPDGKANVFAMFMLRIMEFQKSHRFAGVMSPISWMSLESFEKLRGVLLRGSAITSFIQPEYNAFWESAHVAICCFTIQRGGLPEYQGLFINLAGFFGTDRQSEKALEAISDRECRFRYLARSADLLTIPGSPIAYWLKGLSHFHGRKLGDLFLSGGRNKTHNNEKYLRYWWEVSCRGRRWVTYANGGDFRKYAGNDLEVVDWSGDARTFYASHGGLLNERFWGKEGLTWSLITSAIASFRVKQADQIYSSGSPTIYLRSGVCGRTVLAFLNSPVARYFLKAITPTVNTTVNDVFALPFPEDCESDEVSQRVERCIALSQGDWESRECSKAFVALPLISSSENHSLLREAYCVLQHACDAKTKEMRELEEANNAWFVDAFRFHGEIHHELPLAELTLWCNPNFRYSPTDCPETLGNLVRQECCREVLSYAVGCMMGRYSLDKEGLVFAHSGDEGFDPLHYTRFSADGDGIVPVTEATWFDEDAANRCERFVKTVWPAETLEENLAFVAESLGAKKSEAPRETIRRYFAGDFYKHHLQTYKNRPIYWLFTSGKQGAFEALVYLHRYNEGTLARMRTEYVVPLLGKISGRIGMLADTIATATSTKQRKDAEKEKDKLTKQQAELQAFDEKLRHYADQRITLDLDDGVKVNYGKFGDLLADVKKVCGTKED